MNSAPITTRIVCIVRLVAQLRQRERGHQHRRARNWVITAGVTIVEAFSRSLLRLKLRIRTQQADLPQSLQSGSGRARKALRMLLGDIRLVQENQAVYAEVEASPERLLMASGGSILGVVAGTRGRTQNRIRIK